MVFFEERGYFIIFKYFKIDIVTQTIICNFSHFEQNKRFKDFTTNVGDHPFSTYAKFSGKLTFLTSDTHP